MRLLLLGPRLHLVRVRLVQLVQQLVLHRRQLRQRQVVQPLLVLLLQAQQLLCLNMDKEFWDKTWGRKYERYTRHHQEVWDYLNSLDVWSGNVIDLGCGPCVMYENKKVSLIGVDWSVEALKQARIHYPYGVYIQASASNTGLPTGQFDAIIGCGLLDLIDDWSPVIIEARRLLKPGKKAYFTLLQGFNNHDWSNYPKICGNWHLVVFSKEENV